MIPLSALESSTKAAPCCYCWKFKMRSPWVNSASGGLPQDDLGRQIVEPALGIRPFVRPMPPKLVVTHELRMLPIHLLPCRAAHATGIQHPALDAEAAFGEILPGMATRDGRPADGELIEAGTERDKDLRIVTDDVL